MKTEQITEESSLKLSDQLDKTRGSAQDLGAAFDLNAEASTDVADANEKLAKAINRRAELEQKLNAQQPIVRYSEQDPERANAKVDPTTGNPVPGSVPPSPDTKPDTPPTAPPPDKFNGTLEEYLKLNLGTLKDFKKQLAADEKDKKGPGVFKRAADSTMSAGTGAISSLADTILQGIPGASFAKSAVAAPGKFIKEKIVAGHEKRKAIKSDYEKEKEKLTSKFQKESGSPQPAPVPQPTSSPDQQTESENKKRDNEENKDRKENSNERKENEKRHKGLLDALKNSQLMSMLAPVLGIIASLIAGLLTRTVGIFGTLLKLGPTIVRLGATLLAGMGAAIAKALSRIMPDFMKSKLPTPKVPGSTTTKPGTPGEPTKNPGKGAKTTNTTTNTTRTNTRIDSNTTNSGPKMKRVSGNMAASAEVKGAGKLAGAAAGAAESTGLKSAAKSGGMKIAAKVLGKTLLRFVPFVGTALMAYDIADMLSGGKLSEGLADVASRATSGAAEMMGMTSGSEPVSNEVDVHEKNLKVAENKAEAKKAAESRAVAAYQATSINTTNNKTITASGFAFGSDSQMQMQPYGVQSPR